MLNGLERLFWYSELGWLAIEEKEDEEEDEGRIIVPDSISSSE